MKKNFAWKLYALGGALIIVALIVGAQNVNWTSLFPTPQVVVNLAPAQAPKLSGQKVTGEPVRIVVSSRSIDLSVVEGKYNPANGSWTLNNDKAQFAVNSSVANNRAGNTFIYGHDIPQVFKRLEQLQVGDLAQVVTGNGYVFTYKYRAAVDVDPNNTSIFSYTGAPILTLQTCSGIWSQNRHLMTFDFVEVHKA